MIPRPFTRDAGCPVPASCSRLGFRVLRHGHGHVCPASHLSSAENAATGRATTLPAVVRRSSAGSQSHAAPTLFSRLATVLGCLPLSVAPWSSDQPLAVSESQAAR